MNHVAMMNHDDDGDEEEEDNTLNNNIVCPLVELQYNDDTTSTVPAAVPVLVPMNII